MARILVIDDEEGIRSFLAEALEIDGHDVSTAVDGAAALEALSGSSFDVLLTDLRMPGVDGMAVLAHAKSEHPGTEVLVLTAQGSIGKAVAAMRLGACDFLEKPLDGLDTLRLAVGRALEMRRLRTVEEGARRSRESTPQLTYGAPSMVPVLTALHKVAPTDATVLLMGESGTGKEVAVTMLHELSRRADRPLVTVNCAALSPALLESELFGHEKGAFTGAHAQRRGRIELAEGGTFFLDEVGELAFDLQAKLLRVIEAKTFERVGGSRTLQADVRWVAATHRDLRGMVDEGTFREDLYHRLAVFPIRLPPLRERRQDIPELARVLLTRIAADLGRGPLSLSDAARKHLLAGDWRGNVRELRNTLERAAIVCDGHTIDTRDLELPDTLVGPRPTVRPVTLEAIERAAIENALAAVGGNRKEAAARLGIGLRTLYDKLKRYAAD